MRIITARRDEMGQTEYVIHLDEDRLVDDAEGNKVPDPNWIFQATYGTPPQDAYQYEDGKPTATAWAAWDERCLAELKGIAEIERENQLAAEVASAVQPPEAGETVLPVEGDEL